MKNKTIQGSISTAMQTGPGVNHAGKVTSKVLFGISSSSGGSETKASSWVVALTAYVTAIHRLLWTQFVGIQQKSRLQGSCGPRFGYRDVLNLSATDAPLEFAQVHFMPTTVVCGHQLSQAWSAVELSYPNFLRLSRAVQSLFASTG